MSDDESVRPRMAKLPAGTLERRVRDVCVDWLGGSFEADDPLTVQKIRKEVERRHDRPVSYNGVLHALKLWGKIGAAEIGERPVHFVDFTNAARTDGFKALKARYKEQSRADNDAPVEPEYREVPAAEVHWSDLEAYVPDEQ